MVALERGAEQVGDRPGAEGGQASVSRAGRVRARERWRVAAERRALRAAPRQALRAAPRPTREPPSHTRAHAAERHAVASPGRLQHVSSTRAWRDSSSLRELCLHALLASLCRARRAMCMGAVKPPPRSRGPVLFISNGGEPNSSGASSQVCLHAMGRPLHETLPRGGHEMGYGSECARTRWVCGGDNRFISPSLEPCEVEEEERRASISNAAPSEDPPCRRGRPS